MHMTDVPCNYDQGVELPNALRSSLLSTRYWSMGKFVEKVHW